MPNYVPIQDLTGKSSISDNDYVPVSDGVSAYGVKASLFKAYSTDEAEAAAEAAAASAAEAAAAVNTFGVYDGTKVYYPGEICLYNGQLYERRTFSLNAESSFMPTRWTSITVEDAIRKTQVVLGTADNLLFSADCRMENQVYSTQVASNSGYDFFVVQVESGSTYYIGPSARYVSKAGTVIADNPIGYYAYTADYSGPMMVSFSHDLPGWVVTKNSNYKGVMPYVRASDQYLAGNNSFLTVDPRNLLFSPEVLHRKNYYYNGNLIASDLYDVVNVPVSSGHTYYILNSRFIYTTSLISNTQTALYTLTPASNMKIWVTFPKTARQVITENSSYNEVSPFNAPSLTSAFMLQSTGDSETQPMSQAAVTAAVQAVTGANVLTGKKWVACGDSFTHGDFTGLDDPTEYTFQDAPYQGENMVYPFFIGRRTGAVVSNIAVNGMTMAAYSGASAANCFSYSGGAYTNIPSDADYITLYFGINDSHRDIPIGTLTDTVNTTFYGAWNTVMEYLITNYPNAKIGIIISNGCESTAYPNAEIEIAKRWGVAYFDMNGDYRIPLVFRTNGKTDIAQSVMNLRMAQYSVGIGNSHPNVACHKDESTFIQAWLESI